MKICTKCEIKKSLDKFNKHKSGKNGLRAECKICHGIAVSLWNSKNLKKRNKYSRQWRKDNPRKTKSTDLKKKYGISIEDYEILLKTQNNTCAICSSELNNPCVDHCHETKQIRGLLCRSCNLGLGNFRDKTEVLNKAIKYLRGF